MLGTCNLLSDDSGSLAASDDRLQIGALLRMVRKEGQLVMMGLLMPSWLALVLKTTQMLQERIPKRKVSRGISISAKRLELLHHHGYLKM